jgi:DNA-directed RNA polymerase alpha subunit
MAKPAKDIEAALQSIRRRQRMIFAENEDIRHRLNQFARRIEKIEAFLDPDLDKFHEARTKARWDYQQETARAVFMGDPELLQKPVADIQWQEQETRITNALKILEVETIGQLIEKQPYHLRRIPNCGEVCIAEIETRLAEFGLRLGMAVTDGGPQ